MEKERKANDNRGIESMEEHVPCAILSSPEKLDESLDSPGSDETDASIEMSDEDCEEEVRKHQEEGYPVTSLHG